MHSLIKIYIISACLGFGVVIGKPNFSFGQNPDSLYLNALKAKDLAKGIELARKTYKTAQVNNNKIVYVRGLYLLVYYFWEKGINDSAKIYGRFCLKQTETYHLDSLKADTWLMLGLTAYSSAEFGNAIDCYNKALTLYKIQNRQLNIAIAYKNIGICENELSRNAESIRHFLAGVKIFENLHDNVNLSSSFNAIALCFSSLGNFQKALEYNKKALYLRIILKDNRKIGQSFNNIGYAFKQNNSPDSAIAYLNKSVVIYQKEKDSGLLVLPLQNIGSCWKTKGFYKKALNYINRSLSIARSYGMKEELARGNLDLADLYSTEKKDNKAVAAVKIAENMAIQLKLPELLMEAYTLEVKLCQRNGNYKDALYYDNKRNKIKDSVYTVAKDKTIGELEAKYQTNQKERDLSALTLKTNFQGRLVSQQRRFIIILVVSAVLLVLLLFITYSNFRIKNKANIRIRHLMQELHHRVKNNLQILSGLFTMQIESLNDETTKNTLRENETRLTSMNLIHNKLYLDHGNSKIEMEEYLTKLLYHIKDSFDGGTIDNISLKIDIDPFMMEADRAVAVGLIVNELATNAFKYAFDGKAGEVFLSLKKHSKTKLLLRFSDNGKGINAIHKENEPSFGLKLVNLMARQLNSKLIAQNNDGTCYTIEINI